MLGKLDNSEIEEVLKEQFLGRIGCHANDLTYIVPVSYAYDGRFIYGISKNDGFKLDLMRKNPKICFEVERIENMANWKTVIAWGTFEEVSDPAERKEALHLLLDRNLPSVSSETVHLSPDWPFKPEDANSIEGVVYRVELKDKTGRFESKKEVTQSKSFERPVDGLY